MTQIIPIWVWGDAGFNPLSPRSDYRSMRGSKLIAVGTALLRRQLMETPVRSGCRRGARQRRPRCMESSGRLIRYSPSDITEFMLSPYAAWMSRFALDHP